MARRARQILRQNLIWAAGYNQVAIPVAALGWLLLAALCQIGGTAMMLVVMGRRAFGVAYAYIKTEPVLGAVMGVVLVDDRLPGLAWLAVSVVTAGVLISSTSSLMRSASDSAS